MRDEIARAIDRAYAALDRNDPGEAERILEPTVKQGGEGVGEAWVVLAEARTAAGDQQAAIEAAEAAVATGEILPPEDWATIALILARTAGHARLLQLQSSLDLAADSDPGAAAIYIARGTVKVALGQMHGALDEFTYATELDEDSYDGWIGAANAQRTLGEHADAAESYQTAAELAPDRSSLWMLAGEEALAAENYVLAAGAMEEALKLDGGAAARVGRARAALALGIPADAVADLRSALDSSPDDPDIWELLGDAEYETANDREAAEAYARATALDPSRAAAWRGLGEALWSAGDLERATEALRRAAESAPDDPEPLMSLAALLFESGRAAEAEQAARRALEIDPRAADAVVVLARTRANAGDQTEARVILDRGLEHAPESLVLYTERARWFARNGLPALAERDLEWTLESAPDFVDALSLRGRLALEAGDHSRAAEDLARAAELDPADAAAWLWLGRAHALLGRQLEAVAAWARAEELLGRTDPERQRLAEWQSELDRGVLV
jgi:tetratricopeptide (TPR) repeat protein